MKVLFFCNVVPVAVGAFENLLLQLGRDFRKAGDELVVVFGGSPLGQLVQNLQAGGVRCLQLDGWSKPDGGDRPWRLLFPGVRFLMREKPDVAVVHFGDELPCAVLAMLGRLAGLNTRWVWQQDQQIAEPQGLARCLSRVRILATVCDRFVAMYEGGALSLSKRGVQKDAISVIYNSVAEYRTERATGWLRRELNLPENAVLLVTIGSLIARKRHEFHLGVMAELCKTEKNVVLLIVGEGPLRNELGHSSEKLGVGPYVHFLGRRSDAREILSECDIYVHAATEESGPYATVEAMCAAVPSVATRAGAVGEQIDQGQSGFVVERDDRAGFITHVRELIGNKELRRAMGVAARTRWQQGWQLEAASQKYHALYRSLCATKSNQQNMQPPMAVR